MLDSGGRAWAAPIVTGVAIVVSSALLLTWWRRRARGEFASSLPDTSVPEALHTLLHGSRVWRARAARALTEILSGEVQVLEEILDEARGVHPEFGGGKRADGCTILGVALNDLAVVDADAEAFADLLLQCTCYDTEWDESDEWNQMTLEALKFLRDNERADRRLEVALKYQGGTRVGAKIVTLRNRLNGERVPMDDGQTDDVPGGTPGMLSMNTRVYCPVCLTMCPTMVRCPQCRNVGYCSEKHLSEDAPRHCSWCFARPN